ncbi:hypothetical protein VP01_1714g3 [Puccinia sorghi]|uniref:Uncharacterized protein n=1 Tax=Puccinia sorghi TaxID=27349 RepID=A0A0L6VFI1_9BASI|nr:hypothetical protein VP01_1714g3 [Puccinia sorghi]
MVFVSYAPATKVAVVQMSLQGHSQPSICNTLGYSVSAQSLYRWNHLFELTGALLSSEDCQFHHEKTSVTCHQVTYQVTKGPFEQVTLVFSWCS